MAATGTVTVAGEVTGLPGGSKVIGPVTTTNSAAVSVETQLVLASGDNTITVPATAKSCIIIFAAASTTTKKLKGAGGDTGITVTKVGSVKLDFDTTPPANFIINSSAADTGNTTTIIFV